MTLLALCFANFMIGTGIDESEVRGVYKDIVSSCRQLTCASSLLSLSAWKVILDISLVSLSLNVISSKPPPCVKLEIPDLNLSLIIEARQLPDILFAILEDCCAGEPRT